MSDINPTEVIQVDVLTIADDDTTTLEEVLAPGGDVSGLDVSIMLEDGTGRRLFEAEAAELLRRLGYGKPA